MIGNWNYGTGRRKSSVARVFIKKGTGQIVVNGKPVQEYFGRQTSIMIVKQPLMLTANDAAFDIKVNVHGGGESGQAGAVRHGITRALIDYDAALKPDLSRAGFVTRDAREVGLQRQVLGLELAHLLRQPLLGDTFGLQKTLGRVGHRDGAVALAAQLVHLEPALRKHRIGTVVDAGDALAELVGPHRDGCRKAEHERDERPAQRPRQAATHRDAGRAEREPASKQFPPHAISGPENERGR